MTKIIGIRRLDYTNKEGRHVLGYSVHFGEETKDTFGLATFNGFLGDDAIKPLLAKCPDLGKLVGQNCDLVYNRYGKLDRVNIR